MIKQIDATLLCTADRLQPETVYPVTLHRQDTTHLFRVRAVASDRGTAFAIPAALAHALAPAEKIGLEIPGVLPRTDFRWISAPHPPAPRRRPKSVLADRPRNSKGGPSHQSETDLSQSSDSRIDDVPNNRRTIKKPGRDPVPERPTPIAPFPWTKVVRYGGGSLAGILVLGMIYWGADAFNRYRNALPDPSHIAMPVGGACIIPKESLTTCEEARRFGADATLRVAIEALEDFDNSLNDMGEALPRETLATFQRCTDLTQRGGTAIPEALRAACERSFSLLSEAARCWDGRVRAVRAALGRWLSGRTGRPVAPWATKVVTQFNTDDCDVSEER